MDGNTTDRPTLMVADSGERTEKITATAHFVSTSTEIGESIGQIAPEHSALCPVAVPAQALLMFIGAHLRSQNRKRKTCVILFKAENLQFVWISILWVLITVYLSAD